MSGLPLVREAFDGIRLYPHLADANGRLQVISAVNKLLRDLPSLQQNVAKAQRIADLHCGAGLDIALARAGNAVRRQKRVADDKAALHLLIVVVV